MPGAARHASNTDVHESQEWADTTMMLSRFPTITPRWTVGLLCVLALGACSSSSKGGSGAGTPSTAVGNQASSLLNKALQEEVSGNVAQAKTDFTEVVRLDPNNKFAHYNLGLIAQRAANNSEAESEYRQTLTIDPKYPDALYNLAILRANAGAGSEAIDLYRRVIAADAKFAAAHFNLGLLLRGAGKTADGNAEVQTAVKLDPSLAARAKAQGIPLAAP